MIWFLSLFCLVSWSCRIHRLHICWEVKPPQWMSCYDTKQSDGEVPVMLELCRMRSTPSLPWLPGPLWPGVLVTDTGPIYGLNRTNGILKLNWIVWLNRIAWNRDVFDNSTVLIFKLRVYANHNYFKKNCLLTLKLYLHETELFNMVKCQNSSVCKKNLYLY